MGGVKILWVALGGGGFFGSWWMLVVSLLLSKNIADPSVLIMCPN